MKRMTLCLVLALTTLAGCTRMPLWDQSGNVGISYSVDIDGTDEVPESAEFNIYDTDTGKRLMRGFMDSGCKFSFALSPGIYDFIVFTRNTTVAGVTHANQFKYATAESTSAGEFNGEKVFNSPDQLYVNVTRGVTVPIQRDGEIFRMDYLCTPLFDTWKVVVEDVDGLGNFFCGTFLLGGQYRDMLLWNFEKEKSAILKFPGSADMDSGTVTASFNTLGMTESKTVLRTTLTDNYGFSYTRDDDVSSQMTDPGNTERIIRISMPVELKSKTQGGFQPGADEWNEIRERWDLR